MAAPPALAASGHAVGIPRSLIPEHDVEPHEQFPGKSDDGFGAAAPPIVRKVRRSPLGIGVWSCSGVSTDGPPSWTRSGPTASESLRWPFSG